MLGRKRSPTSESKNPIEMIRFYKENPGLLRRQPAAYAEWICARRRCVKTVACQSTEAAGEPPLLGGEQAPLLFEPDAKPLLSLPNHATRLLQFVTDNVQREAVGYVKRRNYLKLSTRF
jgi:hypothetical protein